MLHWAYIQWKLLVRIVVVLTSQRQVLDVVRTLGAAGCLACGLNRGKQQGDEDPNDGNDD